MHVGKSYFAKNSEYLDGSKNHYQYQQVSGKECNHLEKMSLPLKIRLLFFVEYFVSYVDFVQQIVYPLNMRNEAIVVHQT